MTRQTRPHHQRITIFGELLISVFLSTLSAPAGFAATAVSDPGAACASLADLANFPVTPTQITSTQFNQAGAVSANRLPLPAHCQVDGIINRRTGSDGYPYGDGLEVRYRPLRSGMAGSSGRRWDRGVGAARCWNGVAPMAFKAQQATGCEQIAGDPAHVMDELWIRRDFDRVSHSAEWRT